MTPRMGNDASGAIIALNKPAGLHERRSLGSQGSSSGLRPSALAFSCAWRASSNRLVFALNSSARDDHDRNTGISEASEPKPRMLVHASAGVPPQLESMSPIGTCSLSSSCLAKKYATAENVAAVSGVQAAQG